MKVYIKKNKALIKNIVLIWFFSLLPIVIDVNSNSGIVIDIVASIIFIYIIPSTTLKILKKIDRVNLERDLYCLGMRICGVLTATMGILIFTFGYSICVDIEGIFITYLLLIVGLLITFFGAFCLYRSTRRYGLFVYVR